MKTIISYRLKDKRQFYESKDSYHAVINEDTSYIAIEKPFPFTNNNLVANTRKNCSEVIHFLSWNIENIPSSKKSPHSI